MFKNTAAKGFHMTFQNGYMVSVQWGAGNYCNNRNSDYIKQYKTPAGCSFIQSEDAEMAILFGGEFVTKEIWLRYFHKELFDDVVGHVSPEDAAKVLAFVANL